MTELPAFDTFWDYNDPAATEQRFRDLLPAAAASGDASYHAQLLTQIARTQGLQRQFEAAHETLNTVEKMLIDSLTTARVRYILERGRVYNSSKNPSQARPLFLQAWDLAQQAGEDYYAVDAAHMIAIVESSPDQQIEWNLKAIAYAEQSQQSRARNWLGSLYNNMGWTYHDMKEYDRALDMFQKALAFREQDGKPGPIRIARWSVARVLRSLNRVDEALKMQQVLLEQGTQAGDDLGYNHEEIAECLVMQNRDQEARPHFALAYQSLSQDPWLVENEPDRITRLKRLGGLTA